MKWLQRPIVVEVTIGWHLDFFCEAVLDQIRYRTVSVRGSSTLTWYMIAHQGVKVDL